MAIAHHAILLLIAVAAVGVLHTMVPDHWAPISLLARRQGWTAAHTARTAALAGLGHTISTLAIAVVVWIAGAVLAVRFGHIVSLASSLALVGFGVWIALASWRELHGHHEHAHSHFGHAHVHRHAGGLEHRHWHEHHEHDWHPSDGNLALEPTIHEHEHATSSRTALLLILGSSPMVEGIPAFFAASRYGAGLLAVLVVVFAAATIVTYVVLSTASARGMQRVNLGRFEEYGEVISGAFIAMLGIAFLIWPVA